MTINNFSRLADDYLIVSKAIASIPDIFTPQTVRDHITQNLQLDDDYLEKLFERWAGIGTNRFFQFLTWDHTRRNLITSRSRRLFERSSYPEQLVGHCLNGTSVHVETMTTEEFKRLGAGMNIIYGFHPSPFGECFLVRTDRGISYLGFVESHDSRGLVLNRFQQYWPDAILSENLTETDILVNRIFEPGHFRDSEPLQLLLKGTDFQISVWQALLRIPAGSMVSYEDVAIGIGHSKAVRAVGSAVAANPVGYLVPCHRVIAKSGCIHRYGWGVERKKAMLGREAAAVTASGAGPEPRCIGHG